MSFPLKHPHVLRFKLHPSRHGSRLSQPTFGTLKLFLKEDKWRGRAMTMMSCRKKRRKTNHEQKNMASEWADLRWYLVLTLKQKHGHYDWVNPQSLKMPIQLTNVSTSQINFLKIKSRDLNTETHAHAVEQNERQLDHRRLGTGMSEMSVSLHK